MPDMRVTTQPAPSVVHSVIGVATFRRLAQLADLLPLLDAAAREVSPRAAVVVIDNDPDGGARSIVTDRPGELYYRHEPEPGIAAARNRALSLAVELGADVIAFIDDDERPAPGWLAALIDDWRRWGCAAVAGPVVPEFERPPAEWVATCGSFASREHHHGATVAGAATSNLLLDLSQLARENLRFDNRFGLTGGSDSLLTRRMTALGLEIRWSCRAVVTETVPVSRATRRWVLRRNLRTGNGWSRVALELAGTPRRRAMTRLSLSKRALYRGAQGSLRVAAGMVTRDIGRRATGQCDLATAGGLLLGVVGLDSTEYARPSR